MASAPYIQIALVTGANQGIGFEIAKQLTTEHKDYHVIMAGRRQEAVDEAVAKLTALGLSVTGLLLDVTDDESIARAAKEVEEKHVRLDVLVNNAAISWISPEKGLSTRQQWLEIYNTNVAGVLQVTDAFLPLLEKSQAPTKRIVMMSTNLGSVALKLDPKEFIHTVEYPAYSTSKTALHQLTAHYIQRKENDPTWKINLHNPGYCATNLTFYAGSDDPALGAAGAVKLATLGPDGPTGTFTGRDYEGEIPW